MNAEDSPAPAYFAAFYRALVNGVFGDELSDDLVTLDSTDRWYEAMRGLAPDDPWWDDKTTPEVEDRAAMMRRALVLADAELRDTLGDESGTWFWQDMHTLTIRNATFGESGIAPIEWLFNRGPYGTGGTGAAPNATDWNIDRGLRDRLDPEHADGGRPRRPRRLHLGQPDRGQRARLRRPLRRPGQAVGSGRHDAVRLQPRAVEAAAEETLVLKPLS